MRFVIKYGGTSVSSAKDIRAIVKHLYLLSKKHQIVVVCSATNQTTDDLLEILSSIKKEDRSKTQLITSRIISKHKLLAKQTIKKIKRTQKITASIRPRFYGIACLN